MTDSATPPSGSMLPPTNLALFGTQMDDDSAERDTVARAVKAFTESQRQKAAKKNRKLLTELQTKTDSILAALKAQTSKDVKDMQVSSKKGFGGLEEQLKTKHNEINALISKFQHDLHSTWNEYSKIYSKLDEAKADCRSAAEKKRASLKRRIETTEGQLLAMASDAEQQLKKVQAGTEKLPDVIARLEEVMMQM